MEKTIEIEGQFDSLISNPAGIPCRNENSEQLRKEHDRWKKEAKLIPNEASSKLDYWQKISACSTI